MTMDDGLDGQHRQREESPAVVIASLLQVSARAMRSIGGHEFSFAFCPVSPGEPKRAGAGRRIERTEFRPSMATVACGMSPCA